MAKRASTEKNKSSVYNLSQKENFERKCTEKTMKNLIFYDMVIKKVIFYVLQIPFYCLLHELYHFISSDLTQNIVRNFKKDIRKSF